MSYTVMKNNTIAIVIHICISLVLLFPVVIVIGIGISNSVIMWLFITVCIVGAVFLYLWAGTKYLYNTRNVWLNILSVIGLAVIILVVTQFAYNSFLERFLRIPFFPLGSVLLYFMDIPYETFDGEEWKNVFLLMSPLPSITMWVGINTNKWKWLKL